jgi:hypothetical protein
MYLKSLYKSRYSHSRFEERERGQVLEQELVPESEQELEWGPELGPVPE